MAKRVTKKAIRKIVRGDAALIDLTKWAKCKSESEKRLEWIKMTNALWELDKDNSKFRDVVIKPVREYCESNKLNVTYLNDSHFSTHLLIIGYLLSNGCNYAPSKRYFVERMKEIINKVGKPQRALARTARNLKRVENRLLEQIELLEDRKLESNDFGSLKQIPFTKQQLNDAVSAIEPRFVEYRQAASGDREILEGYSYTTTQLKKICKWYQKLMDCLYELAGQAKTATPRKLRKPRKKKTKTAFQLVQKLNFCRKDESISQASIDPKTIVGAKSVVLFNSKKNEVMYLRGDSLSVNRSSIVGFDPSKSYKKKARSFANVSIAVAGTRLDAEKGLQSIKSIEREVTGRVNQDWLILKAYNR